MGKREQTMQQGSAAMLVLALLKKEEMYGYQMIEELRRRSDDTFHLKAGSLYPLLHGLEEKGYVEAYEREAAAGKPRRYYHLTSQGKKALQEKEQGWNRYADAVRQVLGGGACCVGV